MPALALFRTCPRSEQRLTASLSFVASHRAVTFTLPIEGNCSLQLGVYTPWVLSPRPMPWAYFIVERVTYFISKSLKLSKP